MGPFCLSDQNSFPLVCSGKCKDTWDFFVFADVKGRSSMASGTKPVWKVKCGLGNCSSEWEGAGRREGGEV